MRASKVKVRPDAVVAGLILATWALNLADCFLTSRALGAGLATEGNRLVATLLHGGTVWGLTAKMALVSLGAYVLWRVRRHRFAVVGTVCLAAAYSAVVTYETLWLLAVR